MTALQKAQRAMEAIWDQIHRESSTMPPDLLVLEGEHDIIYLYNSGFVDTDKFSLETWLRAFRHHKQKNGEYHLNKSQWLEKTHYRFNDLVYPPFDPMRLREGTWTTEQLKQFAKDVIIPETTITYEQYLKGLREAERKGTIKDGKILINKEWKEKLQKMLDAYPSPRRRRALGVQTARRIEEVEAEVPHDLGATATSKQAGPPVKSAYKNRPDERKEMGKQLSELLLGGKK